MSDVAYCKTCITRHPSPSLVKNKSKTSLERYGCRLSRLTEIPVSTHPLLFQSPMPVTNCQHTKSVYLRAHVCVGHVCVCRPCVCGRMSACLCTCTFIYTCLHVCGRTCHTILHWDHRVPYLIGAPAPLALRSLGLALRKATMEK